MKLETIIQNELGQFVNHGNLKILKVDLIKSIGRFKRSKNSDVYISVNQDQGYVQVLISYHTKKLNRRKNYIYRVPNFFIHEQN